MAALTANRPVPNTLQGRTDFAGGVVVDMILTASTTVYEGSFVSVAAGTGTVAPTAAGAGGTVFVGIALKKVTSAASGTYTVPVLCGGYFQHALASVASADIGKVAFASDDNTLTLTDTSNTAVGRIVNVPATGTCVVKMKTVGEVSGAVGTTYTASGK